MEPGTGAQENPHPTPRAGPALDKLGNENNVAVFNAALRYYRLMERGLIAVGVIKKPIPRQTRLGLLRELRDFFEGSSAPVPERLKRYLTYYFGSVSALKTDRKLLDGWSKSKITATIVGMHRCKENLAYAAVRRESTALVSAAEAYFGSWGWALDETGIGPNLHFVHHSWRRPMRCRPVALLSARLTRLQWFGDGGVAWRPADNTLKN